MRVLLLIPRRNSVAQTVVDFSVELRLIGVTNL